MLFRSLGLSVALEPLHVFSQIEADDERRPDMLIRNPLGGGPQTVVEVAVSSFNNLSRTNNNKPEQVTTNTKQENTEKQPKKIIFAYAQPSFLQPVKWARVSKNLSSNKSD